jgi:hypothetical protein
MPTIFPFSPCLVCALTEVGNVQMVGYDVGSAGFQLLCLFKLLIAHPE